MRYATASRIRLVQVFGLALLVVGFGHYSQPLGLIIGGAIIVVLAELADRSGTDGTHP